MTLSGLCWAPPLGRLKSSSSPGRPRYKPAKSHEVAATGPKDGVVSVRVRLAVHQLVKWRETSMQVVRRDSRVKRSAMTVT